MSDTKKSKLWDAYETDERLEEEGVWVEMRAGVSVRIRSEDSSKARTLAADMTKKQRRIMQSHGWVLPPELVDKNEIEMCARALVVDWKGVTDKDGTEIPYSPENVRIVLKALPKFRQDILYAARTDETFKSIQEDMAGNSEPPSKDSLPSVAESK